MDAYKIGVSIVLANGVSPVLAIIGKDLLGLHTSTQAIQRNFGGWSAALIGVGSILAGSTILGAMTKLAEKAANFQDALTKVSQLNPKVAELVKSGEIQKMAFGIGTNLGMKVEDVTKVYGGIYGVLQDPHETEELTPIAARYARLMQMRHPGSKPENSINTLMRAGELSGRLTDEHGKIDPKKVEEWFDMAARLEAATHGQVNPEQLLGLAQQGGGVALRGLSTEGYEHMAIMAQMMGGQRAGTALLSLRAQMGGTMMKRSAAAMQEYGILNDGEWTTEGGHVQLTEAASKRLNDLVSKDPMNFVEYLVQRLEKRGITDKDDQMSALQRILGRQTTQRMIADMMLAREQIKRETAGLEQGVTVRQGLAGYDHNIHAAMQNVSTAWHNLLVSIGGPEGERFADMLNRIGSAFNWMTAQVGKLSPETIDLILKLVAGFAAGLIVLGGIVSVALISTLISVPVAIAGAVAAVAAAVGTLAYLEWDKLKAIFEGISQSISGFIDRIVALYDKVKSFVFPQQGGDTKQFKKDLDEANKMYVPMRFDPSSGGGRPGNITLALNLDGRTLAQAVSDQMQSLYDFSTGGHAADGAGRFASVDQNFTS